MDPNVAVAGTIATIAVIMGAIYVIGKAIMDSRNNK